MTPIELTKTEFIQRVGNFEESPKDWKYVGDKPCIVDFHAPWCGYCRRIGPAYEKIAQEYGDRMEVAKINIDEEAQLAEAERVEIIPTLILYKNGKAVDSVVNPGSKAAIDQFIQEALAK